MNTWERAGREHVPALLAQEWDVLVIGGGITGAGILLEAARRGLRAVLVEQKDFAWGTSSRSSKLVHGGLRYLKEGKLALTRESVQEREHLLASAPGLVERQRFAFGDYLGRKPGRRMFLLGLAIYDWLAGHRERHYYKTDEFLMMAPNIAREGLVGGMCYTDAKTDDARLVLRVLQEAQSYGGQALNYVAVGKLLRGSRVEGAVVRDAISGAMHEVRARVVINATGAWAAELHAGQNPGKASLPRLRPLRGSHLVFPAWKLPLAQAVSLMHPLDGRPVFAFPWEGATVVGTTDVDHGADLRTEAAITEAEVEYIMAMLTAQFPSLGLRATDAVATYAGVRPVIDSGQADPSKEGRDHAVWVEPGLVTVTGGKLTTFRTIALDALRHASSELPGWKNPLTPLDVFQPEERKLSGVSHGAALRLAGRYGGHAAELLAAAQAGELELIPGTETLWAELRWAARAEAVQHLEDLLLRRTRLGLLLMEGGREHMDRVRTICQRELGWSDQRWHAEETAYLALCKAHYSLPAAYA